MKIIAPALLMTLLAFNVFAQTPAASGIIIEVSGTVEILSPGSPAFVAAAAGDQLGQDAIISTGFNSSALIEIGSTLITVRPVTQLSLSEIEAAAGTETLSMNLQAGRVRVDLNPPAGVRANMSVASPVATAAVRGTSFEFDTRSVRVLSGRVAFSGADERVIRVSPGFSSYIERDGSAADPIEARFAALLPPSPVGTDSAARASSAEGAALTMTFTFRVNYQ